LRRAKRSAEWNKKIEMKLARMLAIAIALLSLSDGYSFGRPAAKASGTKTTEIFQGGIVELRIPGVGLSSVEGRMGKAMVPFFSNGSGNYTAFVGADLEAKPGLVTLTVKGTTTAGIHRDSQISLLIKPKAFKKESFSVGAEFDQLSPEVLERIRKDQDEFAHVFMMSSPDRLWRGPFVLPVSSEVSSPFGYRRVINGAPRAPHTGVDLRAALGSEVVAANDGRVVLLGDFFFSGNSVVLDHGAGLYTMYFHLSAFKVEMGAAVRKGDVIALSGMTGRVTGPHLHWGARINGARVDPFELVNKLGNPQGRLENDHTVDGAK
jgi:murein DD-endopeptidase MepM/ murein hydrolase activator NlpD